MAIIGIGVDIIDISRIENSLDKFGARFLEKIMSEKELNFYKFHLKNPSELSKIEKSKVAKIFSVKEAVAKAMGTGFRGGVSFQDISLFNNPAGKPIIEIKENSKSAEILAKHNSYNINVSLSDDHDKVVSFVVIDKN